MKPTTCKHYRSPIEKTCGAGIRYADVCPDRDKPGWALRLPCHTEPFSRAPHHVDQHARRGTCASFCLPTGAEIDTEEAAAAAAIARMRQVYPLIESVKREHAGTTWRGTATCPVCSGVLALIHKAGNGHVWGKCLTKGCVAWME